MFYFSHPCLDVNEAHHIRVVLHIFVSASTTLLNNVVTDPTNSLAESDMRIIEPLLKLLGVLAKEAKTGEIVKMYKTVNEAFERTTKYIEEARRRLAHPKLQEKPAQKESVEDFIRRIEGISAGDYEFDMIPRFDQAVPTGEVQVQGGSFTEMLDGGNEMSDSIEL